MVIFKSSTTFPEVVQTVEQNDIPDEKPVEQDLSDILSESKIDSIKIAL